MAEQAAAAGRGRLADNYPILNQIVAAGQGGFLVVFGILGFFVTGFDNFSGSHGEKLGWFSLNPLANVVNIVIGAYALASSTSHRRATTCLKWLFLSNLFLFLYGAYAASNQNDSYLASNGFTTGLHLVLALLVHW